MVLTMNVRKSLAGFLCALLLLSGCASSRSESGSVEVADALREELDIGYRIHQEILNTFYIYTEPRVVSYVRGIGQSLSAHAARKELPYDFTILYNDKIYATSAPGGHVYVTTGLINFLENEAELAAVLAHEIGQLQYQDPRFSEVQKMMTGLAETGAAIGPAFGHLGMLAAMGLVMMHAVMQSRIKTPEEKMAAADRLALDYLVTAGYDPQGLMSLIQRFLMAETGTLPYFFDYCQARPISPERFEQLQVSFSQLELGNRELETRPRVYQDMTRGIREMYKQ